MEASLRRPLELSGVLVFDPEAIVSSPIPQTFLFLDTGDGGIPQEVELRGHAALTGRDLRVGQRVRLRCSIDQGLWVADDVELLPPATIPA